MVLDIEGSRTWSLVLPAAVSLVGVFVAHSWIQRNKTQGQRAEEPKSKTKTTALAPEREAGGEPTSMYPKRLIDERKLEWPPVIDFVYPKVTPHPVRLLADIDPIEYRPFRWGQYNVTMGIRNMPWDEWIEVCSLSVLADGPSYLPTLPVEPKAPGLSQD
jgi:hypothetical protein